MARIIDLTHPIQEGMPVYPGTEPPTLARANTIEKDGFAETLITMFSHTGTHVDAPAHMLPSGPTLDQLSVDHFVGTACVLDATETPRMDVPWLESKAALIEGCDFVLFHTGWFHRWGHPSYYNDFPVLEPDAARWLASRNLKGVGFDAISADPVGTTTFENHFTFFRRNMILVENLADLTPLLGRTCLFSCLPLSLKQGDGSPVRAVAMI